jgi:hypothetical protein
MEHQDINLVNGSSTQIHPVLRDAYVDAVAEEEIVRLVLATQSHQATKLGVEKPRGATILVVDMTRETAYEFAEQFSDLVKRMGWPPLRLR